MTEVEALLGGGMVVVCGAGGMGKTTLAAQVAHRARAGGRAVFWVQWRGDATLLADDLTRIVQALQLSKPRLDASRSGREVLVDVVWGHLAGVRGWVIVIDNLDTPARVGDAGNPIARYRGWLRPEGSGLLLVTSRDVDPATWGPAAHLVPLEPLDSVAAGEVLHELAPGAGSIEDARVLGKRLGGLPLALDPVGRYLAAPTSRHPSFAAYRRALEVEFAQLLGAEHPRAEDPQVARTVVRHTWDLSLRQLADDGYPLARTVLRLLALLAPAPIPRSFITPQLVSDATGSPIGEVDVESALAGLHRYGLITAPGATIAGENGAEEEIAVVVLHPLVHDIMALGISSAAEQGPHLAALDENLQNATMAAVEAGRDGWPMARLFARHLPAILDRADEESFIRARNILDEVASALDRAGAYGEVRLLREQVLAGEIRHLGPDHPDTLATRDGIASAVHELGHYKQAVTRYREILADRERVHDAEHPLTLACRHDLAFALNGQGHYEEAVTHYQEILPHRERLLGPGHPHVLASRHNLAFSLHGLGRHQEAVQLLREVYTEYESLAGADHVDTLTIRHNLAAFLNLTGRHEESAALHRRNLADRERILGPEHPDRIHVAIFMDLVRDTKGKPKSGDQPTTRRPRPRMRPSNPAHRSVRSPTSRTRRGAPPP